MGYPLSSNPWLGSSWRFRKGRSVEGRLVADRRLFHGHRHSAGGRVGGAVPRGPVQGTGSNVLLGSYSVEARRTGVADIGGDVKDPIDYARFLLWGRVEVKNVLVEGMRG